MNCFKKIYLSTLIMVTLLAFSCNDDDGSKDPKNQTSFISVKMVDAPGDYEHVYVDVQDVMIKVNNDNNDDSGWISVGAINTGVYDLLDLTGGINVILASNYEVPSGLLNQIRLVLGSDNSVVVDGVTYPLNTPSAQQSGLKIKVDQILLPNISYDFILDFDADASIVLAPDLSNINLKPVIRASVEAETGLVSGIISDFNNLNSQVIIVASNGVDTITTFADETGNFTLSGLPSGTYTITVSAESNLGFSDVVITGVQVSVGLETIIGPIIFQ